MASQANILLKFHFWLHISIGFSLFCLAVSQIPLGSKISVVDRNLWVSSNGNFALGFFNSSSQPCQYSFGIRFNSDSIPVAERTVVWVAGADLAVSNKSYFQITGDGELILFDSSMGVVAWSSSTSQLSVSSALLHDNGNFVLLNQKKEIVWQSFDTPSDTLLPGQKLPLFSSLRAAKVDSVSSYYSLYMNASGELQLRWESDVIYWTRGSPSSNNSNMSAVLTGDGSLQLLGQESDKPVWALLGDDHNDPVKFRFLRLDVDGNLRMYSWDQLTLMWRSVWQAVENQCNVFATCGERGICSLNVSGSAECMCPYGSQSSSRSHCLVPYQEGCKWGSIMLEYEHTFLHGMYPPNDSAITTSLQNCKDSCEKDPLCTAATFTNDGTAKCFIKTTRYLTGYSYNYITAVSFVKKCSDPLAVDPNLPRSSPASEPASSIEKSSYKFCIPCLVGASSGTFIAFVLIQLGIGFYIYKRRHSLWMKAISARKNANSKGLVMFTLVEINEITGDFKHRIGPNMYKGMLLNRQAVAVKDLVTTVVDRKFRVAVLKIGSIHHRNLVKLEGHCCESSQRYLVYEYAKNGSLEKYIEDPEMSKRLTWRKRMDICVSVARAVCYLHSECREFVGHGNLKSTNVVLDEYFEAKVSEFGLMSIVAESASRATSAAENDVEDFGKLVLELVSGCREVRNFLMGAYEQWRDGKAEDLVCKEIQEVDSGELERVLRIAFWCLQVDERLRPSMGEVVKVLEGTLSVDPPPPPFSDKRPAVEEDEREGRFSSGSESV
ncbi:G-type lectin S-receptor-like serine/threonine-protein kinase SD3-1 [Punica granatum]|uniref:Receptor-like serine/threonine-protein kinase n=2 Tax=Punica granatum TaxID=22663 RepID=A0A218X3M6_PUNGR|nr:G-type lectin S-receptor-like serine/threonine-protein kinase SD3-1 [Punica granatum]OWM78942.1 hypothetical protein CDL15_Pgr003113 [Punica granatum]PKI42855.1 hypothetical protein CRG98_036653 [Punica granatum]